VFQYSDYPRYLIYSERNDAIRIILLYGNQVIPRFLAQVTSFYEVRPITRYDFFPFHRLITCKPVTNLASFFDPNCSPSERRVHLQ